MELHISEKMPSICLNMIVKNESHIIKKTLEMLCDKIKFSYWVICDTGSTDDTKQIIIDFFKTKQIQGELHNHIWKNFAHNRTLALEAAFDKTDLLFIFDADDEIHGTIDIPTTIDADGYLLNFGNLSGLTYQRILLVNNRIRWIFKSIIHEYIACLKPNNIIKTLHGNYFLVSGRSGNRNNDNKKYLKDAKILEEAYYEAKNINDNIYFRYGFYCANSYKDAGIVEDAIKWYKITLSNDNWNQEKYMSCLNLYYEYKKINEIEKSFYYLVESFKYDTERMECVYHLVNHYCINNLNNVAYQYYALIRNFYETKYLDSSIEGKLFVENDKANFYLPYYMIIVSDKVKDSIPEAKNTIVKMYEIIFIKKYHINNDFYCGCLLYNLQFFIDLCMSSNGFIDLFQSYIDFLENKMNVNLFKHHFLKQFEKYGIKFKSFQDIKPIFSKDECHNCQNVLIYTGFSNLKWNDTYSITNAIGGSETAVINLTRSFIKNVNIFVCGSVAEEKIDNISYVNLDNIKNLIQTTPFHTIIISRYISFYEMFPETSFYKSFIWGHDIVLFNYGCNLDVNAIIDKWNSKINGCICQTEWHKNLFSQQYPQLNNKFITINNGIEPTKFIYKSTKFTNRFIYTSCAERGLERLLELWPQIVSELPDAELYIASYNKFPKNDFEMKLNNIIEKYDNIKHFGTLNKEKLYDLMSSAEFWLYPTNFNETSCITAMEMLMSEVICIYYPVAGLNDTLGNYGIPIQRGEEISTILNLSIKQKKEFRRKGKEYALSCSWDNRAKEWIKLLNFNNNVIEQNKIYVYNINIQDISDRMFNLYDNLSIHQSNGNILKNISKEFTPIVIYDIGASTLHWTKEYRKIWNNSEIICFDSIEETEEVYKSNNIKCNIGLLSDQDHKVVKFYENKENPEKSYNEKISKTLKTIVKEREFNLPDLIKIDVQGAELYILSSSMSIINNAKYLIIELQSVECNRGAPLANATIDFLNKNGWEIVESKFSDNGSDTDYLFINNKYKTNILDETEYVLSCSCDNSNLPIWCFYYNNFTIETVSQFIYNQYLNNGNKYKIIITDNRNKIIELKPARVSFIFSVFDEELINIINYNNQCEISLLQTEPLNISLRINTILNHYSKYPFLKIYDYSKTNIKILNAHNITNCEYLAYNIRLDETNKLKLFKNNNKDNQIYDFGFIHNWKNLPIDQPHRKKVIDFLKTNGFTVNIIAGYDDERDIEISKCKMILNIHGQINVKLEPEPEECTNIFEHIRCDRLLECGFNVLSETSFDLDNQFIQKYNNLKIINYCDFFNKKLIKQMLEDISINDNKCSNIICNNKSINQNVTEYNKMFEYGSISKTDKVLHHEYHKYYDLFLKSLYDLSGSIVEIGVGEGLSIPMWSSMFKHAHIYSIDKSIDKDNNILNSYINNSNFTIFEADQSNIDNLIELRNKLVDKNVFFINDDGSHVPEHQLLTFNILFPILLEGGIYIIEDIETSYWTKGTVYGYKTEYGFKHKDSIIEIFKDSVDILNREFINGELENKIFCHDYIESVTFCRNCIIIKKNYNPKRDYRFKHFVG